MPYALCRAAALAVTCLLAAGTQPSLAAGDRCPILVDPKGDANANQFVTGDVPAMPVASVPAGDILSGDFAEETQGLVALVRVLAPIRPNEDSRTGYLVSFQFDLDRFEGGPVRVAFNGVMNLDGDRFEVQQVETGVSPAFHHQGVSGVLANGRREIRIRATWPALKALLGRDARGHRAENIKISTHRYIGNNATGGLTPVLDRAYTDASHVMGKPRCSRQNRA